MKVVMRKAKRTDVEAMNRIFNSCMKIEGTVLDIDNKDEESRLEWFAEHDRKHPVFVGELDGTVICWASLDRYSWEYAYDGVSVLSMHLDPNIVITGLRDSLLRFVESQARELGYYKLVVSIFASNRTALHSYRAAGFRDVGIYRNHGYYKGELMDMVFMERMLPCDMEQLKNHYREQYPCYEEFFTREEALQEIQMLRNGMMRSPEDPTKWVPVAKDPESNHEDWGGATIRPARGIPSLDELVEQRLAEKQLERESRPPEQD